jgi:transcriptional regulator with XRE-family HTH domain
VFSMSDRSKLIDRLIAERDFRAAYIRSKLDVLIPSQLRGLRRHEEVTQPQLAELADMKQSRISAMETPGLVNYNQETLVRMAATFGVGLVVKFVSFSEMLAWENDFSQDTFQVPKVQDDIEFLHPERVVVRRRPRRIHKSRRARSMSTQINQIPVGGNPYSGVTQMTLFGQKRADVIQMPRSGTVSSPIPGLSKATAVGAGRRYGI